MVQKRLINKFASDRTVTVPTRWPGQTMMHYLVVTVWHVLGTTVVQVVFALEHHSLAFRAKSATTTRVALSPVTALFRMVELRSVLPMAPYVQDISARYKALNSFFFKGGGEYLWHGPRVKGAFCAEKRQNFG